ncbi:MAG: M20 family metallopeptidase [Armatimonadota bacterium]
MLEEIKRLAEELTPRLVEVRRQIHQHPELAFCEEQTAALVAKVLTENDVPVRTGVGKTGVVGLIAAPGGKCFGIRTDMDALPVEEDTGLPFASQIDGIMHACGHDCNTTMGLGAGLILSRLREHLGGAAKLIFQPAEEGMGGAQAMIADGVLDDPPMDGIVAAHVDADLPVGSVGFKPGVALAAADEITILVQGKGAHAAHPEQSRDPVVAAAQVVLALQTVPSRRVEPGEPVVVTIGAIHGGEAHNVIPPQVRLRGTVRTRNEELRDQMPALIEEAASNAAAALGCTVELRYERGAPVLKHDDALTDMAAGVCRDLLGEDNVDVSESKSMGAEDFAVFAEAVPATQMTVGGVGEGQEKPIGHHPRFMVDEGCLPVGAAALAAVAMRFLSAES